MGNNASAAQGLTDFGTGAAQGFLGVASTFTGGMIPGAGGPSGASGPPGQTQGQLGQLVTLPAAQGAYAPSSMQNSTSTGNISTALIIAGAALVLVLLIT